MLDFSPNPGTCQSCDRATYGQLITSTEPLLLMAWTSVSSRCMREKISGTGRNHLFKSVFFFFFNLGMIDFTHITN